MVDFFSFHSSFFSPVVFLIFCWLEWLRVWTYLFIQVSAVHYIQIVETDMTSLLCVAEALEALVLIVGGRGTEHQNAQTRKIFSCLLRRRDFFGTVNKLEALQLGIAFYLFATGRPCNIPWRRSGLNMKLARSCMVLGVHFFLPCQILISLRMLFHSIFVLLLMYLYYCSFGLLWKMWSVKSLEKTHRNNFGLNRFGREKNQTKINLFELIFGSVRFKNLKKIRFDCLFWSKTGPNRKCSALKNTISFT